MDNKKNILLYRPGQNLARMLVVFFLSAYSVHAQPWFKRNDSVEVSVSGNKLKLPWSGGLNFCQFSSIDLDLDGIKDLFVFDRCSPGIGKISTFINKGSPNVPDYRYAPEYRATFPDLNYWVLLMDYNCDGKEDIFTSSPGGMAVYKNISNITNGLQFTRVTPLLKSNYNPNITNLYVTSVDLPAISDLDNDGDLDILTFGLSSQSMEFHKNLSVETWGNCDSLTYQLQTSTWGNFAKDVNDCTVLYRKGSADTSHQKTCSACASCSFCLDMDADGDKEIVVGDYSCTKLNKLTNGGTPQNAQITAQDVTFPGNDTSTLALDMVIYPCGYYLDVDNDNVKDLVVSPNAANISNNFNSVWFYKNKGLNNQPVFEFQQKDFLQNEMIETGEGAYPVFFDYNADGLLDLLVGNFGYYAVGNYQSKVSLYQNTGTTASPEFDLVTRDYAGLASYNLLNITPAFGDMDGDGDADMLIGDYDGKLHYFPNTAGAGNPASWGTIQPVYQGIDVGNYSVPQIMDVDRDGKVDLLIGGRNGKLSYYKNTGTASTPVFTQQSVFFGGINVTRTGFISGYAYPFLFDQSGSYKLMVGSESGWIYFYDNIDGNLTGNFNRVDSMYLHLWDGPRSAIHGADINNDGLIDLVLGNYGGGLSYFSGQATVSIHEPGTVKNAVEVFPNPTAAYVDIQFAQEFTGVDKKISLLDIAGKIILTASTNNSRERLNVSGIPAGMYILRAEMKESLNSGARVYYKRIVLVR